jgi:hypothetical protein
MQITRTRGDTYADSFTISNAATGDVVNLAGCSFKLTLNSVQNPVDTTTQVYQLDGVITDATTGVVEFAPTEAQANQIGFFYFDIEMTDGQGYKRTLVKDSYIYKQDITKSA